MSEHNPKQILFSGKEDQQAIKVEQQDNLVSLHFDNGLIETQIDLSDPAVLPLKGNRQMLSPLLFGLVPARVMLVGCGGGSIARWFHHHLPETQGIAVEKSATVIDLAWRFFEFPSPGQGWQIIHADASEYLQKLDQHFDLIIIDIESNQQTPDWVSDEKFLINCQRLLSVSGTININLIADTAEDFARQIWPIRQVFQNLTYCHASHISDDHNIKANHNIEAKNIFVTGFKAKPDMQNLQNRAENAEKRFGIEFSLFYQELLSDNPSNSGIF